MLNESQLKEKLQEFSKDKFSPPDEKTISELIPTMLTHIGSTDPVLRDDLIYSAFAIWIFRHNALPADQLRNIFHTAVDEKHLLFNIGERETDSVFTRAFSALLLPLLLDAHRKNPYLSPAELQEAKEKLIHLFINEQDLQGYVDEKGWAHAIAHAADAFDDLVLCTEMGKADLMDILEAIRSTACKKDYGYSHLEDERMVTPVIAIINREIMDEDEIVKWVQGFEEIVSDVTSMPEKQVVQGNAKNFLQSLYFRLRALKNNQFDSVLETTLQKLNPFIKTDNE